MRVDQVTQIFIGIGKLNRDTSQGLKHWSFLVSEVVPAGSNQLPPAAQELKTSTSIELQNLDSLQHRNQQLIFF